jgi:factor associated with neutral sphingomyelinase activation
MTAYGTKGSLFLLQLYPVLKIRLPDIRKIVQRRFLLRQVGLEIYCENNTQVTHLYLTFKSKAERDALYHGLLDQPSVHLENTNQEVMFLQWQNGVLSNYDYLLYLNSMADRTFNDLTQYPVFPWVIQDYSSLKLRLDDTKSYRDLSKPIGGLNEVRLARLKNRCKEMSSRKFLYGSHYSAPGFVLFYLVRKFPHLMLCLQNGRFDHPDRMFNSMPDVWKNVMTNMSDFKELIPAFYDTEGGGDFLVNTYGINFGYRHDGTKIGDVHLPPWATGPQDFVQKLRDALESDHVSNTLHHWIDLIFGYKQTGSEAEKADNLFYYLCYEGTVDLDSIHDMNQRHALEVQIMEFGQIPKQIFKVPHPRRLTGLPPMMTTGSCGCATSSEIEQGCTFRERVNSLSRYPAWHSFSALQSIASFQSHKEPVTAVAIADNKQFVVSVGLDSLLKMYSISEKRQVRSVTLSSMPLSSCIIMPDDKSLIVGSWDNNIMLYNLEFGREMDSVRAHEDAVSCLAWGTKNQVLVSGSWDCSVRVWQGMADGRRIKPSSSLMAQFDHDAHITCLSLTRDNKLLVSGTQDGDLFVWSMDTQSLNQQLPCHNDTVNAASFSPDGNKLVSCGEDKTLKVFDLTSGMQVYTKMLDEQLRCLCWDGLTLILGGSNGSLYIWDLVQVKLLKQVSAHVEGPHQFAEIKYNKICIVPTGGNPSGTLLILLCLCE